jgi:hypothetical protein
MYLALLAGYASEINLQTMWSVTTLINKPQDADACSPAVTTTVKSAASDRPPSPSAKTTQHELLPAVCESKTLAFEDTGL